MDTRNVISRNEVKLPQESSKLESSASVGLSLLTLPISHLPEFEGYVLLYLLPAILVVAFLLTAKNAKIFNLIACQIATIPPPWIRAFWLDISRYMEI